VTSLLLCRLLLLGAADQVLRGLLSDPSAAALLLLLLPLLLEVVGVEGGGPWHDVDPPG
jgi:hypothetical protein